MIKDLYNNNLGSLLKKRLDERSLSMRKLSELTEIDKATISRIMSGKRKANIHHLQKFASCLEVPLSELLVSAGYAYEKKQEDTDLHASVESIQNFLAASNMYDKKFTLESVELQLAKYEQYTQTEEGKEMILQQFDEKLKKVGSIGPFIRHLKQMYEDFCAKRGTCAQLAIIGGALIYFILPVDVLPDYLFPIGYLDDAIAVQLVLKSKSIKQI
ncbi:DUF1232 domain-containing protein [Bacillus sp. Bva_UNVM-123]|uniref:DUF1232 domain-containing protein n=1 Tax=Bacillus sp. Bva_UNVM-123 TaxID=2829798 RepID=UPI00391F1CBE